MLFLAMQEIHEAYKFVGDKLIELGYCSDFRFNMANGAWIVAFTERGEEFRRQLRQIEKSVACDDPRTQEFREGAILAIFLEDSHPPERFFRPLYPF